MTHYRAIIRLARLAFAVLAMGALASPAETELKTIIQQTMEAYVKSDSDFLERAFAEEFTIVDAFGGTSTKGQELSEVAKKDIVFTALKMTEVKVRTLGENYALVTGVSKGAGKFKGEEFDLNMREVICYEKNDDKWRAIFWQSTEIKPEGEE